MIAILQLTLIVISNTPNGHKYSVLVVGGLQLYFTAILPILQRNIDSRINIWWYYGQDFNALVINVVIAILMQEVGYCSSFSISMMGILSMFLNSALYVRCTFKWLWQAISIFFAVFCRGDRYYSSSLMISLIYQ